MTLARMSFSPSNLNISCPYAPGRPRPDSIIGASHRWPVDCRHEDADVLGSLGSVVDVIGMLVHIEREDGRPASQCVAMVRGPLIDEFAIARRPRQQNPAGTSAERFAHRYEFRAPPLERAEIAGQHFLEGSIRLALITEAIEEMLMEDHRIHGDKFFTLEAVDQEGRRVGIIKFGELLSDKIQPLHRAAIV